MARIPTWRNVSAVDTSGTSRALEAAGRSGAAAVQSFQKPIAEAEQIQEQNYKQGIKNNTSVLQSEIDKVTDLKSFNAAKQSGQFGVGATKQRFGAQFDQNSFMNSVRAKEASLKEGAFQKAFTAGMGASKNAKKDKLLAGMDAVRNKSLELGLSPEQSEMAASRYDNKSGLLKKQIALVKEKQFNNSFDTMQKLARQSGDPIKAINYLENQDIPTGERARLRDTFTKWQNNISKLTPIEQKEAQLADLSNRQELDRLVTAQKSQIQQLETAADKNLGISPVERKFVMTQAGKGPFAQNLVKSITEKMGMTEQVFTLTDSENASEEIQKVMNSIKGVPTEDLQAMVYSAAVKAMPEGRAWWGAQGFKQAAFKKYLNPLLQKYKNSQAERSKIQKLKQDQIQSEKDLNFKLQQNALGTVKKLVSTKLKGGNTSRVISGSNSKFYKSLYAARDKGNTVANSIVEATNKKNESDRKAKQASVQKQKLEADKRAKTRKQTRKALQEIRLGLSF